MSKAPPPKRVREQAVVYLGQRDRALLESLTDETGLSRTELFRRGLWALAAQREGAHAPSAFEHLIATADQSDTPPDLSEHADDYLYGGKYERRRVAEPDPAESPLKGAPRKRKPAKRARPR